MSTLSEPIGWLVDRSPTGSLGSELARLGGLERDVYVRLLAQRLGMRVEPLHRALAEYLGSREDTP